MSLFCFVAVAEENYSAKVYKTFRDERAGWLISLTAKYGQACAQWLSSKCTDGRTARAGKNWGRSLKLQLTASLPDFTLKAVSFFKTGSQPGLKSDFQKWVGEQSCLFSCSSLQSEHKCMKCGFFNLPSLSVWPQTRRRKPPETETFCLVLIVWCLICCSTPLCSPALEFQFGLE